MKKLYFFFVFFFTFTLLSTAKTPVPLTNPDPTISAINYKILTQMDLIRLALKAKKITKVKAASLWDDLQAVMDKKKQYLLAGDGKSLTLSQAADLNSMLATISVSVPNVK